MLVVQAFKMRRERGAQEPGTRTRIAGGTQGAVGPVSQRGELPSTAGREGQLRQQCSLVESGAFAGPLAAVS